MPLVGPLEVKESGQLNLTHPAGMFIRKQQELMKKGYNEYHSFQMVEKELSAIFDK